ncbi:TlpA family protein disulfide reductase [Luteirhabdus pelagi]|uniref:TlpA family protein disulfide reductase n=1 Tax=Luteirhabdus pelagi TaxID=2792783 RepID=UPI00193A27E1|nr:TlpA disulfide reductase family protein [Luteirhabdus pelagi]
MKFIRKNWGNILFVIVLALLLIPQTRMLIQVPIQRLLSFSPSELSEEERTTVEEYRWQLEDSKGSHVQFEEAKGEVVVLNFWATWCPPCVAEMPSFQSLYDTYGSRVKFYFVTSEEPEVVAKFMDSNKYNLPIYFQKYQAPKPLQVTSLPTTFIISKEGTIVVNKTGAADWNSDRTHEIVKQLLKD